ncbi:hypothetical protein J6590_089185 [Homalodisca vitripennis]|nr:hypothetical protein J6590_089185 [Homalodisca vitripennis]
MTVKHSFVHETNYLPALKLLSVETKGLKKQMRGHVIYGPAVFCHRTAAASLSLPPSAVHRWSLIGEAPSPAIELSRRELDGMSM